MKERRVRAMFNWGDGKWKEIARSVMEKMVCIRGVYIGIFSTALQLLYE